jgi:hypothetical protein
VEEARLSFPEVISPPPLALVRLLLSSVTVRVMTSCCRSCRGLGWLRIQGHIGQQKMHLGMVKNSWEKIRAYSGYLAGIKFVYIKILLEAQEIKRTNQYI